MNTKLHLFLFALLSNLFLSAREFPNDTISMLALGDSYTIGHSVDSAVRWPVQLMDSLTSKGRIIKDFKIRAVTGWTTTSLLNNMESDAIGGQFNVVSLLIGVNNFYQNLPESLYVREFQQLLDSAVAHCSLGREGVFVVSIPDYGYTPFGVSDQNRISGLTDRYNFIGDSISKSNGIEFIDITEISRQWSVDPALVSNDRLHPSGKQYGLWVSKILSNEVETSSADLRVTQKPARKIYKRVWEFFEPVSVRVYSLNGQLVFIKTLDGGAMLNLTDVGGDIMLVSSKNYQWSVFLDR